MLTASTQFRAACANGRAVCKVDITFADGTTDAFDAEDIMQGGVSISAASSSASSFDVGSAIVGKCTLKVRNESRQWDLTDFGDAVAEVYIGALVGDEYEWLLRGTYRIEPVHEYGELLTLSCVDALSLLEQPYSAVMTEYPATLGEIVADICDTCGVGLESRTFVNSNYIVPARNMDDRTSCLEVLGWAAQVAGCFADCDPEGNVRLRWYDLACFLEEDGLDGGGFHTEKDTADGGGFHFEVSSKHGGSLIDPHGITAVKSLRAAANPVTIDGLSVVASDDPVTSAQGEQVVRGNANYTIHIDNNPLICHGQAGIVADNIQSRIVGIDLRDVSATIIGDPTFEAGDPIVVTDRHGVTYQLWATQVTWNNTGSLTVACGVEDSSPLVRVKRRTQQQSIYDAKLADITAQIANISSMIDAITAGGLIDLSELETAIGDLGTLVTDLGTGFETLTGTVGGLSTDLGNLGNTVSGINTTVGNLGNTVSGLNTSVGNLNTSVGNINTNIGSNYDYSGSGSIDSRLGSLESSVGDYDSTGGTVEERLYNLENSTSVGSWIIQVDGVAQTTGTINFVTQ